MLIFLTNCQESKSTKTNLEKEKSAAEIKAQKIRDSLQKAVKIPTNGLQLTINLDSVKTLKQEELKPFLYAYAEKNTETLVEIETSFGNIKVRLYLDTPLHRANFIRLVKLGYFDTTFFHRAAKNFVIQGGNSDLVNTSKFRQKVGDYLIPNESKSSHTHVRGAFSAAKYAEQNVSQASSPFEFFIVQNPKGAHHLDGKHTVFGEVISGMDVVDKISQVDVDQSEWPLRNIKMKVRILDE
ncbi:peptidylprolyl isomerase [Mesonia sp. K7]|nr:peptidylprolyl isomerase [Mesonia sp. K7]